jgi:eukaryotic-like serine/threonine-protein kinase
MALPDRNTAVFVGDYEILGRLGAGGMAEILLARRDGGDAADRQVVLKRLLPKYAGNPQHARMFMDEARILSRLHHPNIVRIFDVEQAKGQNYLVMEHLDGVDVRKIRNELGTRVPLEHALAIAIDAAAGLHFAHEQVDGDGRSLDIVHRDVSPGNIVVTATGEVKLIDFGIATAIVREEQTRTGIVKGTQAYMCPEQARAMPLDRRGDVYSLAVVLYELTTGALPTRNGRNHLEAMRPVDSLRARLPDYPRALEEILVRALSVSPDMRPATAAQLREELVAFMRASGLAVSREQMAALVRTVRGEEDPFLTARATEPLVGRILALPSVRPGPVRPEPVRPEPPLPLELMATVAAASFGPTPPGVVPIRGPLSPATPAASTRPPSARPVLRRRWPKWLVPAAAVAAVVLGVLLVVLGRGEPVALPIVQPTVPAAALLTVEELNVPARGEPLGAADRPDPIVDEEVPRRVPTLREQIQAQRAERERAERERTDRRVARRKSTSKAKTPPISWNVDSPVPPSGDR